MKTPTKIRHLLLFPLLAALSGCISSPAQFMMDREVKRLCELDGGVHVYEQVPLSKENFGPRGQVFPQYGDYPLGHQLGPDYVTHAEQHIQEGENPRLWRHRFWVIRIQDNKLLGEWISYHRAGGGIWGRMEGNAYGCDDISDKYTGDVISRIFVRKESAQ